MKTIYLIVECATQTRIIDSAKATVEGKGIPKPIQRILTRYIHNPDVIIQIQCIEHKERRPK